jgi:O-antigen/teichoic acid export membrane protein
LGLLKKVLQLFEGNSTAYQGLVKGGAVSFALRLIGQGVNYGLVMTITRLFGAGGFGAYSLFQAVMQFFTQTARLGYDVLLMRNTAQAQTSESVQLLKSQFNSALRVTAILSVLFSVILYSGSSFIAEIFFNKPHLTFYFKCASLCLLPLVHINIYASYLKGRKLFRQFNFIQQISLLLFTLFFVAVFYTVKKTAEVTAIAYLCSCLVTMALAYFWYAKNFKTRASNTNISWIALAKASVIFFLVGLMNYARNATETLILGHFFTEDYAGIFKAAQKISSVISFTLFSTIVAAAPHFAELYKKNQMSELRNTVQKTTALLFWISLPVFLLLLLFPHYILPLFGKEFYKGDTALMIMCVAQFFNTTMGPANNLLLMSNRQQTVLYIALFNNVICFLSGWFLIPIYGIEGAACINLLGILIPNIAAISIIRSQFGYFTFNPYMLNQIFKK